MKTEKQALTEAINHIINNWASADWDDKERILPFYLRRLRNLSNKKVKLININFNYNSNQN